MTFEEDWKLTPSGRHLARSLGLSGVDELLSVSLLAEEMLRDLPGLGDEDDVFEYLARVIEIGYLRWDGGRYGYVLLIDGEECGLMEVPRCSPALAEA